MYQTSFVPPLDVCEFYDVCWEYFKVSGVPVEDIDEYILKFWRKMRHSLREKEAFWNQFFIVSNEKLLFSMGIFTHVHLSLCRRLMTDMVHPYLWSTNTEPGQYPFLTSHREKGTTWGRMDGVVLQYWWGHDSGFKFFFFLLLVNEMFGVAIIKTFLVQGWRNEHKECARIFG